MSKEPQKTVIVNFDSIKTETAKAILIVRGTKENWVPLSQIKSREPNSIEIPEWLSKKM